MLSRDEINQRAIRLNPGRAVDRYTGTLNDPFQEAQSRYMGPRWANFFGELQKQEEDAQNEGKSYRVGWGGFGNAIQEGDMPARSRYGTLAVPTSDDGLPEGFAGNLALSALVDQNRARLIGDKAYRDQQEQARIDSLKQSYEENRLASVLAPPIEPHVTTHQIGEAGSSYTDRPSADVSPDVQRATLEKQIQRLPANHPARVALENHLAATDVAQADAESRRIKAQADADAASKGDDDIKEGVAGMFEGTIPPALPGRGTKEYTKTIAEAHRRGYDLASAVTDWNATQKHVASMNGTQQLRLNQAVNQLPELLDSVESLAKQWKGGKFPVLNKANLALAKNGVYGPEVASVATRLDTQIADTIGDLGTVYMGGNSPTDHGLSLAAKSLQGDWDEKVILDQIANARKNVKIRQNSIRNTGVAGASATNPYAAAPAGAPAAAAPAAGVNPKDPFGIR